MKGRYLVKTSKGKIENLYDGAVTKNGRHGWTCEARQSEWWAITTYNHLG